MVLDNQQAHQAERHETSKEIRSDVSVVEIAAVILVIKFLNKPGNQWNGERRNDGIHTEPKRPASREDEQREDQADREVNVLVLTDISQESFDFLTHNL